MTAKQDPRERELGKLAQRLVELVTILRRDGPACDWRWWSKESPRSVFKRPNPYQDGLRIFDSVVEGVLKLNPRMLSKREVEKRLAYEFLEPQTSGMYESDHLENESLLNEARNRLNGLIQFEAWQDVLIPIVNLHLYGDPVELGNVTFVTVKDEELAKLRDRLLLGPPTEHDIQIFARVRSPGDLETSLSYARSQVDEVLNVMRAFCSPFGRRSETWQVGMLGSTVLPRPIPMRIANRQFAALSSTPSGLGPGLLELTKELSKLEGRTWQSISGIMQKGQRSPMESKLLNGIQWLGESTKHDRNDAKFVKIAFALEAMIGGAPKDEYLQVRGITAMLAERAAFIGGRERDERLKIDSMIRDYYGKRSDIVHGRGREITLHDLDEFGGLIRRLAVALLDKIDKLGSQMSSVEDLERWVKSQRYTLPGETTQGGS